MDWSQDCSSFEGLSPQPSDWDEWHSFLNLDAMANHPDPVSAKPIGNDLNPHDESGGLDSPAPNSQDFGTGPAVNVAEGGTTQPPLQVGLLDSTRTLNPILIHTGARGTQSSVSLLGPGVGRC